MKKSLRLMAGLLLVGMLVLSGCSSAVETAAPAAEQPVVTEAPAQVTEAPADAEAAPEPSREASSGVLILATTTSTQDSGLLDYLLPMFEAETGLEVDVIAVGTGQALTLGQDGNADVLLVHARAKEDDFMTSGHGVRREDVMYNDFVIVGPAGDPAGISGMTSAVEAFKKIAETQSPFLSRGDE
ncbi:MAG: substrate-binding domain-containing protein, partial [Anaerolineaceae bacterium]